MAFDPITAALTLGNSLINRLIPDKAQNDAAKAQLLQMQVAGELQNALAQLQVDQVEAANQNVFIAGWRPFIGWVCGTALVYGYIIQPFATFILVASHRQFDPALLPKLDNAALMALMTTMLGMGAMRSWDKANGNGNGH